MGTQVWEEGQDDALQDLSSIFAEFQTLTFKHEIARETPRQESGEDLDSIVTQVSES